MSKYSHQDFCQPMLRLYKGPSQVQTGKYSLGNGIGPTFTHSTCLTKAETSRVCRTASKTCAHAMRHFMNDDASLQIPISVRRGAVPEVHPYFPVLAIRRRHEIRVVISASVLCVRDDCVVLPSATAEIVLLEVTGDFVEPVSAQTLAEIYVCIILITYR